MFVKEGETFVIGINGRTVTYWDRLVHRYFKKRIQYLPPDESLKKLRNIPKHYKQFLDVPQEELNEWKKCNSEEEIREFIIKDAVKNGARMIKELKK